MLYDTHCHPYLAKNKQTTQILTNFQKTGDFLNTIGVDIPSSLKSLKLAQNHEYIYASIGIHPCDIKDLDLLNTIEKLEEIYLGDPENIVAIGETGLDYYWMEKDADKLVASIPDQNIAQQIRTKYISSQKQLQKLFFKAHIQLAESLQLPIIIHNRSAKDDVLAVLKETNFKNFIFHCYSEDLPYARELIAFAANCKISFSGIVTFKNASDIQDAAAHIPLENIIIETDAPYLAPEPRRGREENEPVFVQHVLEKIISLRSEAADIIQKQIFHNSLEVFQLKKDI